MSQWESSSHPGWTPGATWVVPAQGQPAGPGQGAPAPPPPPAAAARRSRLPFSPALLVALVAFGAATAFEMSFSSYHEVNGVMTECSYTNLAPLLFGPVAAIAGLVAALRSGRPGRRRPLELILGLVMVGLGLVQVLAGLDLLGGFTPTLAGDGPC